MLVAAISKVRSGPRAALPTSRRLAKGIVLRGPLRLFHKMLEKQKREASRETYSELADALPWPRQCFYTPWVYEMTVTVATMDGWIEQ